MKQNFGEMNRAVHILTLLVILLSACAPAPTPTADFASGPEEVAQDEARADLIGTPLPEPPAEITTESLAAAATLPPAPESGGGESGRCNAAELVGQSYVPDSEEGVTSGGGFTLILRLTNVGACTWTTQFTVALVVNTGLQAVERQPFTATAVPGQTVDLRIKANAPTEPGCHSAAWVLQDAEGEVFGHGAAANEAFSMGIVVGETAQQVDFAYCLTPSEACWDAPKETWLPRYARLMHDPQWLPWPSRMHDPDWASGFYLEWYPETVPLWTKPRGGDGRYAYTREWLEYLRALQPNDEAAVWIAHVSAGLFNRGNDFIPILDLDQLKEEPKAEAISSGGNVVRVLEFMNHSARIAMLNVEDSPPSPSAINYRTRPWLITKFTSVSRDGQLGNAGGIEVYFPNLTKQAEGLWVIEQRIEMFPAVPFCAQVRSNLSVRASAGGGYRYGVITAGHEVFVYEYALIGSDVWGRTQDGWVPLVFQIDGQPIYPTSWRMETRPPIVFK